MMVELLPLAVLSAAPALQASARALAERLNLPLLDAPECGSATCLLRVDEQGLSLQRSGPRAPHPVWVDFAGHRAQLRPQALWHEPLLRAVKATREKQPSVIDATAGWGRDAFLLASAGCELTLLERVPVVAALLEDGLCRAREGDAALREVVSRMRLLPGDAQVLLPTLVADVVYLDPMFAERKRALAKKDMQLFQGLVGQDEDADTLLDLARASARQRVVVKRHLKAPPLAGRTPAFQYTGSVIRYDVYLGAGE